MKRVALVFLALVALVGSMLPLHAAETETFTGTAARTGTYKRPLLQVDGKRYELKASDKADASVAETLAKFSTGDTDSYAIVGTRGTVNGNDGIIVDRITPAAKPLPSAGATTPGTKAVQGTVPPAPAQVTPTVTSKVVTVSRRKYTVYEYPDPESKTYCVVIPEGLRTVRGLLVNANYYAGDSRGDWTFCHYYREFMHLHDFALVVANGTCPHTNAFKGFRTSLQKISVDSKHPELVNAPYVAVGFSAGGGFASTLMTYDPDRTIAAGIIEARYNFDVFTRPNPPPGPTAAHLAIPSVLVSGGKGNTNAQTGVLKMVDDVFVPHRPKSAEFAWVVLPNYGHEYAENRQDLLIMPLMDLAVRTRYPKNGDPTKGPIKLITIDPTTGWVADNTTWQSGLTKIVPAREFKGDLGHSSWLQSEDIAFIYRAYATHNNPITITSPGPCGPGTPPVDPGSNVPITVDASKFPNWTKLEFYDGAKKLGTVTTAPAQFTATNLTPGYHVFSVIGTGAQGAKRSSDPRMVVVSTPPTDVPAAQQ
jgi:hypothetical protein